MSKVQLSGNASGTGIFQIAAPNSNTDRTLTLPDNTGTLISTASTLAKAQLPTGSVLQVVSYSTTSQTTTSSSTYVASNLSTAITPLFSTSKILVILNASLGITGATNTCFATLYRNNTNLGGGQYSSFIDMYPGSSSYLYCNQSILYLDSPATTSSTTYALYLNAYAGSGSSIVNPNSSTSTITLLEIAA